MGSRSSSLRTKVVALLLSLAALWSFAAWVTVRDGLNLLEVRTLDSRVFRPSGPLLLELQVERRLSVAYLAKPGAPQREALNAKRQRTQQLAAAFKESARSWQAELAGGAELDDRVRDAVAKLDGLAATRSSVDSRSVDRTAAARAFTEVLDSIFGVYDAFGALDDKQLAKDTANLIELRRARELAAQEDALIAGVLAAGRITEAEYARFVQLVGAQRFAAAGAAARLPAADRSRFEQLAAAEGFSRFRGLEDRMISSGRPGPQPPVDPVDWRNAAESALAELQRVVDAGGDAAAGRATPIAIGVLVRLLLVAGFGLLAVAAAFVVSITTARTLVDQLDRLREAARQLANQRLPGVVARLGRGEEVDVAAEAPPLAFGDDEIGQVGQAFNAVQETAVRTAVEQAELRRNVRDVFLSIARRSQALVHRQLTLLDAMERREQDAEELEDLFRVDHLATRMRRNAENLIVLSGSTPGRAWRRNVPMVDVVRGAVAEVEDYTRVTVAPFGPVALAGRAVGDVIHLLAELIENALSFSPPHTTVEVKGQLVANGYVIEVEDRGLGMSEEELDAANDQITSQSAEFNLANASRLGLFVVSRLTERHGVRVQLKESPYGGTTAVVLVPAALVADGGPDGEVSGGFLTGQVVVAVGAGPADEPARPGRPLAAIEAGSVAVADPPARAVPEPSEPAVDPAVAAPQASGPAPEASPAVEPSGPTPGNAPTIEPADAPATDPGDAPATDPAALMTGTAGSPVTGPPLPVRRRERPPLAPRPRQAPLAPPPAASAPTVVPDAPAGSADAPSVAGRTASGLPLRVRQASIAPALRELPDPAGPADEEDVPRVPERVRRMMSAYQSGTRRGRAEAARLLAEEAAGPTDRPPGTSERADPSGADASSRTDDTDVSSGAAGAPDVPGGPARDS